MLLFRWRRGCTDSCQKKIVLIQAAHCKEVRPSRRSFEITLGIISDPFVCRILQHSYCSAVKSIFNHTLSRTPMNILRKSIYRIEEIFWDRLRENFVIYAVFNCFIPNEVQHESVRDLVYYRWREAMKWSVIRPPQKLCHLSVKSRMNIHRILKTIIFFEKLGELQRWTLRNTWNIFETSTFNEISFTPEGKRW
jgi:hypothetical protein